MTDSPLPLVMVPGLDGTGLLFYKQIPELSARFRVETFPLPDDSSSTMESLVSDLDQRIAGIGERVLLFGESFGGALSLSYALAHPQSVRGLIILNSFPVIRKRLQLRLAPSLLRAMPWGAMSFVRRFTRFKLHSPHARPEDLREFFRRTMPIGKRGYIRRLQILRTYDLSHRLKEIRVPTLFLAADRDKLVPSVQEAEFMAARMPHAEVRVLGGYGHICIIDHDFHLLEHIEPWLSDAGVERRERSATL